MTRKILVSLCLLLQTMGSSFAQKSGAFSSVDFKAKLKYGVFLSSLQKCENGYLYFNKEESSIIKFDQDLNVVKEAKVPKMKTDKLERKYFSLKNVGGKFILLFSLYKNGADRYSCGFQTVDPSTLLLNDDVVKAGEYGIITKSDPYFYFAAHYNFDSSLVCFIDEQTWTKNKRKGCTLSGFLLERSLKIGWSKQVETSTPDADIIRSENIVMDNEGDIFCLSIDSKSIGHVFGFPISSEGYTIEYELKPSATQILNSAILSLTKDDELIICGLYTYTDEPALSKGSYFIKFVKGNKKSVVATFDDFTASTITDIMCNDMYHPQPKKSEALNLKVQDVLLMPNKQIVLIAEQGYAVYTSQNNMYYSSNIVAVSYTAAGKINWLRIIPKQQISSWESNLHYIPTIVGNNIYFTYNDNKENIAITAAKPVQMMVVKGPGMLLQPKSAKCVVFAKLSPDGVLTKESYLSYKEDDCLVQWYSLFKINGSTYFMEIKDDHISAKVIFK